MFKSMMFTAVASTAVLLAATAGAADLRVSNPANPAIHIALAGKSDAQVRNEIRAAANTVCAAIDAECLSSTLDDANAQLAAIAKANRLAANPAGAHVEVARTGPSTIRVSLAGKSRMQIDTEINQAAQTVCKTIEGASFSACVADAVRDAKNQLRYLATADQPRKVASN